MSYSETLEAGLHALDGAAERWADVLRRFRREIDFADRFAASRDDVREAWRSLIVQAVETVVGAVEQEGDLAEAVRSAERILAPIGNAAKAYTIHCVGHGHIDMNWMWDWPETVATVNDTFSTVDLLMEAYPEFRFSQSQASVYQMMKDYLPELYGRVKERVRSGQWEITANQWVEGDKNLASGESLCRHLLYTKRFFEREFGLSYDAIQLVWEPDVFGHAHTVPGILADGGVRWYYFCRAGHGPQLFWWQGKDGSRVLAWEDSRQWYNGPLSDELTKHLFEFEAATGLKDYLFVYGVGDHGGGPTRRDIEFAREMNTWPIFPNVVLSTAETFFKAAEKAPKELPVVETELNFVFEGCFTSQSNIKRANRLGENALVEAEAFALVGESVAEVPYPTEGFATGWRHVMFNQFHDILPGSGSHATYEYAQGLFQEVMTITTTAKTRALRAIARRVRTASESPVGVGPNVGSGPGDLPPRDSDLSRWSPGGTGMDAFVVFNPSVWPRSEVVTARVWDRDWEDSRIVVADDAGNRFPAQVLGRGGYWAYRYIELAFPVEGVPGLGYRSFTVAETEGIDAAKGCSGDGRGTIENAHLKVVVDPESGAIAHLIDKRTGIDLVPEGERLGLLEYVLEAPHGMSSWVIGQAAKRVPFSEVGATLTFPQNGPYLASVVASYRFQESTFQLTISLAADLPRVDFTLETNWLERGDRETGVPALRVLLPVAVQDGVATYECPNGSVTRPTEPSELPTYTHRWSPRDGAATLAEEVPAQKWADLTGTHPATTEPVGATLVNESKYGHMIHDGLIRLSLLRSSYEPDPLPELGQHRIRFALRPHVGEWSDSDATREGYAFNVPFNVVATTPSAGDLPPTHGYAELLTPNVMLSGMKKAEDSDALIVRLYEMEGKEATARLRLDPALAEPNAPAVQTDVLERPVAENTASMEDGILSVQVPPYRTVTVKIG